MKRWLVIAADDYGYAPAYDRGILEAVAAGAVDSVGAMVMRAACDPAPLDESGVEVGLHLELPGDLEAQLERFAQLFGRPPAYLDGHHHAHARAPQAAAVAQAAAERGLAVRSVDARHRRALRSVGVPTVDRLIGRLDERAPALPEELAAFVRGAPSPPGVTEWFVHPGHRDPHRSSSFDAGREADLELLLRLAASPRLRAARTTHAEALGLSAPRR